MNQAAIAKEVVGPQIDTGSGSVGAASPSCTMGGQSKVNKVNESGTLERVLKMLERVLERTTLPVSGRAPSQWLSGKRDNLHWGEDSVSVKRQPLNDEDDPTVTVCCPFFFNHTSHDWCSQRGWPPRSR